MIPKLLVVGFFVLSHAKLDRYEIGVIDCDGGMHGSYPGTDFFDSGMDLSLLKKSLDAGLEIFHKHIKCKCNKLLTEEQLYTSFTPNMALFLSALDGATPETVPTCPEDMIQLDSIMEELVSQTQMPTTCDATMWNSESRCSFKYPVEDEETQETTWMYFAMSACPGSIWPHISLSVETPLIDDVGKPCTTDDDCDSLSCDLVMSKADVKEMVNESLYELNVYKEDGSCDGQDVLEGVPENVMNWVSQRFFEPISWKAQDMSLCGYNDVPEEVPMSLFRHRQVLKRVISQFVSKERHRQVLKRAISQFTPAVETMMQYFHDAVDTMTNVVKGQSFDFELKHLLPSRSLLQESEDLSQFTDLMESWEHPGPTTDHRYFYPESETTNRVNLMNLACTNPPAVNIMGGISKRLRFYLPKYPEITAMLSNVVKAVTDCRSDVNPLSNAHFYARFLIYDISFWLNMFTDHGMDLGKDGYDTQQYLRENMDPGYFEMPRTCTLESFVTSGSCSMIYDNISPLLSNSDVKIGIDIKRCSANPNSYSVSIDCLGADCKAQFDPFVKPCSSDADCPQSTCQEFEVCDPLGFFWGSNFTDLGTDMSDGCPQDSDMCTDTSTFRQDLINAVLKINGDSTTDVGTHTGMCIPGVFNGGSEMEEWQEDVTSESQVGIISIKGLIEYSGGSVWNRADTATPGPDGIFQSSSNHPSFSYYLYAFAFLLFL